MNTLLLLATIIVPAVVAPLVFGAGPLALAVRRLAPWAALPALVLALSPLEFPAVELPWVVAGGLHDYIRPLDEQSDVARVVQHRDVRAVGTALPRGAPGDRSRPRPVSDPRPDHGDHPRIEQGRGICRHRWSACPQAGWT